MVHVEVSLEGWERALLKTIAMVAGGAGLVAAGVHQIWPHPLLPYVAGGGLIVGFGLGIALDDGSDDEDVDGFEDEPLVVIIGMLAAIVGVAVLALGVTTPTPYPQVAAGGFALLLTGAATVGYFGEETSPGQTRAPEVPDDPSQWLDERQGGDD